LKVIRVSRTGCFPLIITHTKDTEEGVTGLRMTSTKDTEEGVTGLRETSTKDTEEGVTGLRETFHGKYYVVNSTKKNKDSITFHRCTYTP
jgi:hypothetical protein